MSVWRWPCGACIHARGRGGAREEWPWQGEAVAGHRLAGPGPIIMGVGTVQGRKTEMARDAQSSLSRGLKGSGLRPRHASPPRSRRPPCDPPRPGTGTCGAVGDCLSGKGWEGRGQGEAGAA
eukprot:354782-Chlamydomonas_euryale.AAC.12